MPVNDTGRKYFTDVVKGVNTFENTNAMQFNFASITPAIAATTVQPMGIPLIYNGTAGAWQIAADTNIGEIGSTGSGLPNDGSVAIIVGTAFGAGFNNRDVDLATEDVTVFFRGANNAGVVRDGIDYTGATISAPNQAIYEEALEKAGIMVIDNAEVVSPTYTS
jgi:3-hydroxy-3-methylglutaryl CoA synthase